MDSIFLVILYNHIFLLLKLIPEIKKKNRTNKSHFSHKLSESFPVSQLFLTRGLLYYA